MALTGAYNQDYYQQINDEETPQAERLAEIVVEMYKPKRVVDVGCATGLYLKPFLDRNVDIIGVDYAPDTVSKEVLMVPKSKIHIADITKKPPTIKKGDVSICLEVFEHVPESGADKAVQYLCGTSDVLIFSAAQPGQGGGGHVNCQPKSYWAEKFWDNGFILDIKATKQLWHFMAAGQHMGWFLLNMGVYVKR